jgi:hypothetical protein
MMWLSWRQFRAQGLAASAALAAVAVTLGATGPHVLSLYQSAGLTDCHTTCGQLAANFISSLRSGGYAPIFYAGVAILYLAPALIGIFWGAPLVSREIESGTFRLAWNQSVPRVRWIVIKLTAVGLAAVATAGLMSLMISWWANPVEDALHLGSGNSPIAFSRISPLVFDARGVAPLGYAAFAFALGAAAGVFLRRTLPAMAVTLAIFAVVQVLVPSVVRPHLIAPVTATAPLNVNSAGITVRSGAGSHGGVLTVAGSIPLPGAWVLSEQTLRPDGQPFSAPAYGSCLAKDPRPCTAWLAGMHLRQLATYQPASRFWPLQWRETGIYLALAVLLGSLCVWQVRRRRV